MVGGDGKSAIVSKAALHMKTVAPDLDGGVESTTNIDPFALIKVGKKWKFDGLNDLITDILPASTNLPPHRPCGYTVSCKICTYVAGVTVCEIRTRVSTYAASYA